MPRSDSPIDLSAIATVETHGVPIVAAYDDDKERFFVLKDRTGEMSVGRGLTTEFFGEELGDAVVEWEVKDDPPRKYNLLKVLIVTENPAHARWQEEQDVKRTKKAEKKAKKDKKRKGGPDVDMPVTVVSDIDTSDQPVQEEVEQAFITELRAGTDRIEGRQLVILRCDEEVAFPNFRIFIRTTNSFETHDFNVHNFFFGGPQQKVDIDVMTKKHERAKDYAEKLGAFFDIEVRDESGFE